jgi:hypothetical protein
MSNFPQNNWGQPQQQQQPQGNWGQPQGSVPQGQQGNWNGGQQQQQWNPQAAGFVPGPPYQEGEFPDVNEVTMAGQVYPNKYMQQGWEFRPNDKGGVLTANIKLRSSWNNNVKQQFMKIVAFGELAQALRNELAPGRMIRFTGQFRENGYVSKKDNKTKRVNQVVLRGFNGQPAYQMGAVLRLVDEMPPPRQQGNWGGQQQGNWNGGQQQQPPQGGGWNQPPQGFAPQQQPAPQQQWGPPQGAPPQQPPQQWGPQVAAPQQQAPQQWGPPQGAPPQQPTHQAMPQGQGWGPGPGGFAPPQGGPQQAPPQGGFQLPPQ